MNLIPSYLSLMKERTSQPSQPTHMCNSNSTNNDFAIDDLEIDSPDLLATSLENNPLISSNSTISLLSLNKSMSRTTSFTNPSMFQRVHIRRYSNQPLTSPSQPMNMPQTVPETPNLDPISTQNSPSNFWLNRPGNMRTSSVNNNVKSPFLVPVKYDGNVTPLILSPK